VSHSDETVCNGHTSDWTASVFDCSSFFSCIGNS
jgi:hypothetical protein